MAVSVEVGHPGGVTPEPSVLVVDDSATVCSALRAYLTRVGGWSIVHTAPDAARGLLLAAEHSPTAIVLDNRMPGGSGIDVLDALRRTCPDAVIVMHTTDDSVETRATAIRLGADGVVLKGQPLSELAEMLRPAA